LTLIGLKDYREYSSQHCIAKMPATECMFGFCNSI
jgi:hypothetical protein